MIGRSQSQQSSTRAKGFSVCRGPIHREKDIVCREFATTLTVYIPLVNDVPCGLFIHDLRVDSYRMRSDG